MLPTPPHIGTDVDRAYRHLLQDDLVAIPTETVYGLAANALSENAVAKIFVAKKRPYFDPLIVHVADKDRISSYVANIPRIAHLLMEAFWPGPLTLLLLKKKNIPDIVTAGLPQVGLRCPQHPITAALLRALPFPLAAPSANPFGYISPTTAQHVADQLGHSLSYILDGGPCRVGIESTIVECTDNSVIIHRLGGITVKQIEKIAQAPVRLQLHGANPKTPGQMDIHYAPRKPLFLISIEEALQQAPPQHIGSICFSTPHPSLAIENQVILSPTASLEEAGQNIYSALRKLDKMPVQLIIAELMPETSLGLAINDRLRRAALKS